MSSGFITFLSTIFPYIITAFYIVLAIFVILIIVRVVISIRNKKNNKND